MSHSFVRGNWRRFDESSPMILAKCCHDTDLMHIVEKGIAIVILNCDGGVCMFYDCTTNFNAALQLDNTLFLALCIDQIGA